MESSPATPATSSGRLFKTNSGKSRSVDEDREKFIEEEYDVCLMLSVSFPVSFSRVKWLAVISHWKGDW